MKKLYSVIIVILTVNFNFANPVINSITANGNWKNISTWNLSRVPAGGDTVVIPAGKIVVIDNVENLSTESLYIKVYGILKFTNGKLWLDNNSTIIIFNVGCFSRRSRSCVNILTTIAWTT